MKSYLNHNGIMREHANGNYCTVFDKNKLVAEMAMEQIVLKNYVIKLEEKADETERTLRETTRIIDRLQKEIKINRTMRKDARYGSLT